MGSKYTSQTSYKTKYISAWRWKSMIFAKFTQDLFCCFHHAMSGSEHDVSFCSSLQWWKPDKTQFVQSHLQSRHHNEQTVLPLHMERTGVFNIIQYCGHLSRFQKSYKQIANRYPNIPWVLIPKFTWNVALIIAPLLLMAVTPTKSRSWDQILQTTVPAMNTIFCYS